MHSRSQEPKIDVRRRRNLSPHAFAADLITTICRESGSSHLVSDGVVDPSVQKIVQAIRGHDTAALFDWMMDSFSFQGISDSVATNYLAEHGNATWKQITAQLRRRPGCGKLLNYWTYDACRYDKAAAACSEPRQFSTCPVPSYPLRNGRLNQTAFSLFFFMRDIAKGDFVQWIEQELAAAEANGLSDQEALVGPMRHIFGVSDKVLTMTLSTILMVDRKKRPQWFDIGSQMIVIDTLVHNFLVRTGILERFDVDHLYGPACYGPGHCADLLRLVSAAIDARQFNSTYPANFPRFVQHTLWRYCAADGLNVCNGNMIDDRESCQSDVCIVNNKCSKKALKTRQKAS
jgi:hypothetical protein